MSRRIPEHGEMARYLGCGSRPPCRCLVCVRGARRSKKLSDARRARGVKGYTPSAPLTAHVRGLVRSGRSLQGIADETGLSVTTVGRIRAGGGAPVWLTTAERLLAARPVQDPKALVGATGTVRRLQALVVMGHAQKTLAAEIPCAYTYISMLTHDRRDRVTTVTEQAVRRMYGRLSMTSGPSGHGRALAARYGWHGPLAWDDDTIDDPTAVPQLDAPPAGYTEGDDVAARFLMGESVVLDKTARREVLAHLMEWTQSTPAEIGDRLGMSEDAVSRSWERVKARARVEGDKVPWRRVYVPLRDMNLTRDDMRSAA